jgi:hypothetical protein
MLPLTQLTAPAAADPAALAAALAAGAVVALLLQAPTTNAVARTKAPTRREVAMMDTGLIPPCPLLQARSRRAAGDEGDASVSPPHSTGRVNGTFADC